MKNIFRITIMIILAISFLVACESIFQKTIILNGIVVRADTNEPVADQEVYCETYYLLETWLFGHGFTPVTIDIVGVKTDKDGKFTALLNYKQNTDRVNCNFIWNDDYYGVGYEFNDTIISEIRPKKDIYTLKVRKFEKINLRIKNENPVNDKDEFYVDIMVDNTNMTGGELYKVVNYGKANEKLSPPASDNGLYPLWIGKNVDAELFYKVSGSPVRFVYHVNKGSDTLEYQFTEEIPIKKDVINTYELNY